MCVLISNRLAGWKATLWVKAFLTEFSLVTYTIHCLLYCAHSSLGHTSTIKVNKCTLYSHFHYLFFSSLLAYVCVCSWSTLHLTTEVRLLAQDKMRISGLLHFWITWLVQCLEFHDPHASKLNANLCSRILLTLLLRVIFLSRLLNSRRR